jgi:transposase InsO family protein
MRAFVIVKNEIAFEIGDRFQYVDDIVGECLLRGGTELALTTTRPEIFNTDQGAQFTSEVFTNHLEKQDITISMDGRGRAIDNIFIERLWRTVKYEEAYLKDYDTSHAGT